MTETQPNNNLELKHASRQSLIHRAPAKPVLRFSPPAWTKLLFLRDRGPTEIGAFGITVPGDPLFITDIRLVRQFCTPMTVKFDDGAVADFFDEQVDLGRRPEEFSRVWLHTHPWGSAKPSQTDEETFVRCFGRTEWAVMFILARQGETYARLRFNVGPGGSLIVQAQVEFTVPYEGTAFEAWDAEYRANVLTEDTMNLEPIRLAGRNDHSEIWELGPEDPFALDDHQDPTIPAPEELAGFDRT